MATWRRLGPWAFLSVLLTMTSVVAAQPGGGAEEPSGVEAEEGTTSEETPEAEPDSGASTGMQGDGGVTSPESGGADGSAGTNETDGGAEEPSPWGDLKEGELPAFLDTTDVRVRDGRPGPTETQLSALKQLEDEVGRFDRRGKVYRETVLSIVRREFQRRRRSKEQYYGRQIRAEERMQNDARIKAIALFEKFVARYPNDPEFTPDAMFRLGELYFERSALQFQDAFDRAQEIMSQGGEPPQMGDTPDFEPTISLYRRLVASFPNYRRLDGVLYLVGYCLNEMGNPLEAKEAWLGLVCANKYPYDPIAFAEKRAEEAETEEDETGDEHPALTLDGEEEPAPRQVSGDPYEGCEPVTPKASFISETWFRVGEFHFDDYGAENSLELAIAAYNRILEIPDDRNYNLALYKVAWAYYRSSRYPQAMEYFGRLIDWSDEQREKTGRAGSELRPEAVQYMGIALAYDDWDENQVPDPVEGKASGIQRLQDKELVPQDRDWTPEIYFQLGSVYFDENKLQEAIDVWKLTIETWPFNKRVPEVTNMIARAYTRKQAVDKAIEYRAKLSDYGQGSEWWNANVENPKEQRQAEQFAENALVGAAIHHHQDAQQLRRECVEMQDPSLCAQAESSYRLAAESYREFLKRYPNNPQAYDLRYNLADALFWSQAYEAAAQEYAAVRDSNLDNTHLSEAARRVVESTKRILDAALKAGSVVVREDPPDPSGDPLTVKPLPMPVLVQRLAQAREIYLARVSEKDDTENVREAYDYNNAVLLYSYGYWNRAKERFERIFQERCSGPYADETGRVAWLSLRNIAVKLGDDNEVERLANELGERKCTFSGSSDAKAGDVDCSKPENKEEPHCLRLGDLNALRYRRALDIYDKADRAKGKERQKLYEQAATVLLGAVNDNPDDPKAPIALEYAATALEKTNRFESAARLYQRIVDEVGPRKPENEGEAKQLDAIMANAYFRLGYNANRFFDFDRAVSNYRILSDSPRFKQSEDPNVVEKREDALINSAIILERLQEYTKAAEYFDRAADMLREPEAKRDAHYRVAEMSYKKELASRTLRDMRAFISRYANDPKAADLVVQAYWRIAQVNKKLLDQKRQYKRLVEWRKSLQQVVDVFARTKREPGSIAAEYAARAKFTLVDGGIKDFEDFKVRVGKPKTMKSYVETIKSAIDKGAREAKDLADSYEPVLTYRRPAWTVAALVRQGRVYEILARAVLNTPFTMPQDLAKKLRRLSPDQRDEISFEVEGAVRQVLDEKVRPIECFAVARYALAARAARAGNMSTEYTQIAVDRLQAYGEERIAECIADAQKNDSSFSPYVAGEFARAPRGVTDLLGGDRGGLRLSSGGRR